MKKWWLRLYTYPAIIQILKASVIPFVLNLLLAFVMPKLMMLGQSLYLYPLLVIFKNQTSTFSHNIDLHKVNIPYPELRKAYVLDALLQSVAFICIIFFSIYVPSLFHGKEGYSLTEVIDGTFSFNALMSLSAFFVMMFFNLSASYRAISQKEKLEERADFHLLLIILLFCLYQITKRLLGPDSESSLWFLFFMSLFMGSFFHLLHTQFGKKFIRNTSARYCGQIVAGLSISFSLFMFFSIFANKEIHDSRLGLEERFVTFSFFSNQSDPLDAELVAAFINISPRDSHKILFNAVSSIYTLPVEDIIKRKNFKAYLDYIKLKRPSIRNLKYITEQVSAPVFRHEFVAQDYYLSLRNELISQYEEAKVLPLKIVYLDTELPKVPKRSAASEVDHEK